MTPHAIVFPVRARSPEDVIAAMSEPDIEEKLASLVKRPTPEGFRRWSRLTYEERLRTAFRLIAFARRLEASHARRG